MVGSCSMGYEMKKLDSYRNVLGLLIRSGFFKRAETWNSVQRCSNFLFTVYCQVCNK